MIRRRVQQGVIAVLATAALATSASASLRVRVEDLSTGTGVVLTGAGVVNYTGPIDSLFTLTITTGTSKPIVGGPNMGELDLSTITVDSTGAGDLRITLEDDTYPTPPPGTSLLKSATSVTFTGGATSLDSQGWANAANQTPDLGPNQPVPAPLPPIVMVGGTTPGLATLVSSGTLTNASADNRSTTFVHTSGPYSLFMQEVLHFGGAGTITEGHSLVVVPEASTVVGFGMLLGLGGLFSSRGLRLRKRQAVA